MKPYNKNLKPLARTLRSNMTDAEQMLWRHLRGKQIHGIQFYRQKPLGGYIVDFYSAAAQLVIELDGSQHQEQSQRAYDEERSSILNSLGLEVLRFNNRQVLLECESVIAVITKSIERKIPPYPPFTKGG